MPAAHLIKQVDERNLPDLRPEIDRKKPVGDQVYKALKGAIVSMAIPPRTSISENNVCDVTGVSRTPVRRAIARLEDEGMIDVYPQRGTFVAPIDLEKVFNGHFIRRAVEVEVVRKAAPLWNEMWDERARRLLRSQQECIDNNRPDALQEFQKIDEQFHRTIAQCAGVEGVWELARDLKDQLDRVRYLAVPGVGHMEAVIAEHEALLRKLKANDEAGAVEAITAHLDTIYDTIERLRDESPEFFI